MIHIFIGTKAQLIKMAPVMAELQDREIEYNFIFSGQHQATIKDIREEFNLKQPDVVLYKGTDITGIFQMLLWSIRIVFFTLINREKVWKGDKKGIVLNHGDTFSTLLGTLSAKICGLRTAHIESGLRSYNLLHPFPEELTRRITFLFTDIYFAPGDWALNNLKNYKGVKINTQANTLLDALRASNDAINQSSVPIPDKPYAVVSLHRFENIFSKKRLQKIIELLEDIAEKHYLLFILHKPTLKKLEQYGLYERLKRNSNTELRPRYSYFQFIRIIKHATFVVTDGGSNQEECYYLGKPCLILRNATERCEGIDSNAVLSKYRPQLIQSFLDKLETNHGAVFELDTIHPSISIVDALIGQQT